MVPEKLVPTAAAPSRPQRQPFPPLWIVIPALFFTVSLYALVSLKPTTVPSAATPIDVAPPAYTILREACQLRFWKRRALPYCERATAASWIDEEQQEAERAPLEVFQVHTPPRATARLLAGTAEEQAAIEAKGDGQKKEKECQSVLMQHTFGWSYGRPFVGGCWWTRACWWWSTDVS